MRKSLIALIVFAVGGFILYHPTVAYAQATRTWVSGVGDDANPCSRTAPCKTFAGAISKTAAGGEIDALDPGGFGALTITKSITIDGGGGQVASVLVAGTNGITIAAAATDSVILRNLRFQGLACATGGCTSSPGLSAINIIGAARVVIDHCVIQSFSQKGILDTRTGPGQLFVSDTIVSNNTGAGLAVAPSGGSIFASVTRLLSESNGFGVASGSGAQINVINSTLSGSTAAGAETDSGASLFISGSLISSNVTGILANGTIVLANDDISLNGTGVSGTVQSYTNNRFFGNGAGGTIAPIGTTSNPTGQQ